MSESAIQVPPDSTGAKLRTEKVNVGGVDVHQEVITHAGPDGTIDTRFTGGKTAAVATVTAAGDTTLFTPAAGNAVRLFWLSAINDPDATNSPLIKVSLGALELYRVYAVAHWELFVGGADETLVVNLDQTGSVAVTAHIQEFTP